VTYFHCDGCNKRKPEDQRAAQPFSASRALCKTCAKRAVKATKPAPDSASTGPVDQSCPWWFF
jgi:hypothetical protein